MRKRVYIMARNQLIAKTYAIAQGWDEPFFTYVSDPSKLLSIDGQNNMLILLPSWRQDRNIRFTDEVETIISMKQLTVYRIVDDTTPFEMRVEK